MNSFIGVLAGLKPNRPVSSYAGRVALDKKYRYLQVAFDRDASAALSVLPSLPESPRVLVEAGTPLIKRHGAEAIRALRAACGNYLVADVKAMDRGLDEVNTAASAGADAVVAMGSASLETLNAFIEACRLRGVDAMVDMMNVEKPVHVLQKLREQPKVIILHRGFDEYTNKSKQLPLRQISDIRQYYSTLIAVAGGTSLDDVQRAFFNGANIVALSDTLVSPGELPNIADEFLKNTK
jgi:bifunctional enzyme Fae/Hps